MNAKTVQDYASDQKLLELSAKAAGIGGRYMDSQFVLEHPVTVDGCKRYLWRPLHDDGDALRLAVHLDIGVTSKKDHQYEKNTSVAVFNQGHSRITEKHKDHANDAGAATRYVIVRAAAEIGKAMQEKS